MNIEIKERFMEAWAKHFPGSELPIACYYSDELNNVEFPNAPKPNRRGYTCIFAQIAPVWIFFKPDILTFSAPWPKFLSMLENMDESFLATDSWSKVKSRFSQVK